MTGNSCDKLYKGVYCLCLYDPQSDALITIFSNPREMSILWGVKLSRAKRLFCDRLRKPGLSRINGTVYLVRPNVEYRVMA